LGRQIAGGGQLCLASCLAGSRPKTASSPGRALPDYNVRLTIPLPGRRVRFRVGERQNVKAIAVRCDCFGPRRRRGRGSDAPEVDPRKLATGEHRQHGPHDAGYRQAAAEDLAASAASSSPDRTASQHVAAGAAAELPTGCWRPELFGDEHALLRPLVTPQAVGATARRPAVSRRPLPGS
jgi:hypothetical protein